MKHVLLIPILAFAFLGCQAMASGFSYAEAEQSFKSGAEPTISQLVGAWKMVGVAVPGTDPNRYNTNGLTNSDGSLYMELVMQMQRDALSGASVLSLGVNGLGAATSNQGPFSATINNTGLMFSTYGYDNYGCLNNVTYPHSCKLVTASGALVCYVDDTNDTSTNYADEYDVYLHE